jgi:hypothetical protein
MSWQVFEESSPDLAHRGAELLDGKIAYLATSKKDGSPRIHPVRPFIGEGHLFLFIDKRSPKRQDLLRDGRYAIHCSVFETNGLSTEFLITGISRSVNDLDIRKVAVRAAGHDVPHQFALFEFSVEQVIATEYDQDRVPTRRRWSNPGSPE